MFTTVVGRLAVHGRRPLTGALLIGGVIVGILAACWPAVMLDRLTTPGLAGGALAGLQASLLLGPVLSVLLVVTVCGLDVDAEVMRDRHLVGAPSAVLADVVVCVAGLASVAVASSGAGALAGAADEARRRLFGPAAMPDAGRPWHLTALLGATLVTLAVMWLLLFAVGQSGRHTAGYVAVAVCTFLPLLFWTSGPQWRGLLLLHPFGGWWAELYSGASPRLRLDAPGGAATVSIVGWLTLLSALAARRRSRPVSSGWTKHGIWRPGARRRAERARSGC